MKKKWKITVMLVAICGGGITLTLFATADHWWKKQNNIKFYVNGKASVEHSVYQSRNGDNLLVKMGVELYIFFPEDKKVATTSLSNFVFLPGYAFSKNVTPPFAFMTPVKSVDPKLIIHTDSIAFNTSEDVRVLISSGSNK